MPQISLYVDQETLKKIERSAEAKNMSMSKWVGETIQKYLVDEYPAGFFNLFGSAKDDTMIRPKQIDFAADIKREEI
jgi:hypothetical protein